MMRIRLSLAAAIVLTAFTPALAELWPSSRDSVQPQARPFDLKDVRLLDGPFRDAMERTRRYLHELEEDRLVYHFRKTAGLPAPRKPLGGWERTDIRSHAVGHYLSACAMMVASTGDEALRAKAGRIVAALAQCQKAHGNGFLGAYPQSYVDALIAGKGGGNAWYRFHKTFSGLIDVYVYCGNQQALQVAEQMAAWAKNRLDPVDRPTMQRILNSAEEGGMAECLATLYGLTGDRQWLDLSLRFVQDSYVEPLSRGEDRLKGEHVNSMIPNLVGTARQYEMTGDVRDRKIAEFFWRQVAKARSYCTGGTSLDEFWKGDPHKLAHQLGDHNQETCCTYNMLKLTRHLFAWKPDRKYADYYERALFNGILATQDPKTGMMMYYLPLASGFWKYFNAPPDTFWCCVGTGMENHARYGESIYFHDSGGLWVNLFIASELNWKEKGVRLRQETRFPEEPRTTLTMKIDRPTRLALRLRVPQWAGQGVTLRVNGSPLEASPDDSGYAVVDRTWSDGDRIEVGLPMRLWAWSMPDDPTLVAVMYGPLVLAGRLGADRLGDEFLYRQESYYKYPKDLVATAPDIVTSNPDPAEWIKPVPGEPLTFQTLGVGRPHDVTLVPYYRLWAQPYAVYWRVLPEPDWRKLQAQRAQERTAEQAKAEARRKRLIDEVFADGPFGQSEKAHSLRQEGSGVAPHLGRSYRRAAKGWFSYTMKTRPDEPMALACTYSYWGGAANAWTFDILVDGTKIATQTLDADRADGLWDVEYPIPPELTRGKSTVEVKFAARSVKTAGGPFVGGLLNCAMLKTTKK